METADFESTIFPASSSIAFVRLFVDPFVLLNECQNCQYRLLCVLSTFYYRIFALLDHFFALTVIAV